MCNMITSSNNVSFVYQVTYLYFLLILRGSGFFLETNNISANQMIIGSKGVHSMCGLISMQVAMKLALLSLHKKNLWEIFDWL